MYATGLVQRRSLPARLLLRKNAFQLGLFGAPATEVAPTSKAKQRKKLAERQAKQLSLLPASSSPSPNPLKAKKGSKAKRAKALTAPKAGQSDRAHNTRKTDTEGRQWYWNKPTGRWRLVTDDAPSQQQQPKGLKIIQDEQISDDAPVTVQQGKPTEGYTIPPQPEDAEAEPQGTDLPETAQVSDDQISIHTQRVNTLQQKLKELQSLPGKATRKTVLDGANRLMDGVKDDDRQAQKWAQEWSELSPEDIANKLHKLSVMAKKLERMDARNQKKRELLSREATGIATGKEQLVGRSEKAIADFLHQAGLSGEVFTNKEFARTIQNPGYEDLAIERQGDLLMLTHYYDQNGDRVPDGEMAYQIFPNGQLRLAYTAAHVYGREFRGLDKAFAATWSRNLVHQGFHDAAGAETGGSNGAETGARLAQAQPRTVDVSVGNVPNVDYEYQSGQKRRLKVNQQVKDLLAQSKASYTQDELTLLSQYSGKGGITEDDGSLSEYYTRSDVAEFVTGLVDQLGFSSGIVLEPSCGNGVFLNQYKGRSDVLPVGVEMDEVSSAAAAALNPHAEIAQSTRFERFLMDNPEFQADAIVGNVPFGTRTVSKDAEASRYKLGQWKDNGDLFVAESLERLKPGGVMALVVPSGIISGKNHQRLRDHLTQHGRMLGAYRLPNDAFKHSGTSVVTDVLLMQRHPDEVLTAIKGGDKKAIAATADHGFVGGSYFDDHPEHILGETQMVNRGFRDAMTVKGDTAEAIQNAPSLPSPAVDYEGLKIQSPPDDGGKAGDEKFINGRLYRLEGNPPRWHLVSNAELEATESAISDQADPAAFGVDSMAEAEAILSDPGLRAKIHPDHLDAYLSLARETLSQSEVMALRDAKIAVNAATSEVNAEKLTRAMLLAGHLQSLQDGAPEDMELEQALNMLQSYREGYGSPVSDRQITALALDHPALLRLQGAFNDDDSISDYFANPDAVRESVERRHTSAAAAMHEAHRTAGGEPVTLAEIQGAIAGNLSDDKLEAALSADPTIGYSNGLYQPMNKLMVGNGYDLMDALMGEQESLPEDSPLHRKLTEQIAHIRSKLQPRSLEDMTTPFWAVGSWIPAEALNSFLASQDIQTTVAYDPNFRGGRWRVTSRGYVSDTAADILSTMNRERISRGSNTKEAKQAIAALENEFRDFLAGSEWRLEVEEAYNLVFNSDLPVEASEDALEIPLFEQWDEGPERKKKRLHGYQASTVRQMFEQGRGMISLGVGLGKTATSIALGLHLKATGRAKKPTFVVPKSVLANWVREIDFWAPKSNVMIVGMTQQFWADGSPAWDVPGHKLKKKGGNPVKDADGNYVLTNNDTGETVSMTEKEVQKRGNLAFSEDSAAVKERKLQQLSQNAYDIVLMSEPVFQQIGLHPDTEHEYLEDVSGKGRNINPDAKKTHKMLASLEAAKLKLAQRTGDKTKNIDFESLGIDALIHDEAHHLKNLFGTQRTGDVAFMSQAESNRALDSYYKSRYIREQNNNQNVYLLTATPTTNNPLEAYNMLSHICPDEFEKRGIDNVDDFLGMFGQIESVTVPGVDLQLTEKNGLVGFKNLKDLRKLFGKYCRLQSAKDVGLPIPEEATQDHYVDMSPAQAEAYADLKARAKELMSAGGEGGKGEDHIFSVISDMDKAAIDIEYYNETHSDYASAVSVEQGDRSPKIDAAVKNVMASLKSTEGKQIVFCDAVQMHSRLKDALVEAGYPNDQIQIVNAQTAKKSSDRQKISQSYNDGRTTLVIGNTATMGEGMNFQVGTTDIHHLTTPWTPAAIEQRNGRGVRQGNALDEVGVHYYHANKSFDAYRKGVVERKRGWIDELWKGDQDAMSNQNTGGINMDEIAVMMADNPEDARRQLAENKEAQMTAFKAKQQKAALRQFGQLQTMRLAYSKIHPDSKTEARAIALKDRIRRTTDALGRNEYFPHKALLDGSKAAYVGSDGTVLTEGHHIKESDGAVWRITNINAAGNKIRAQQVSGPTQDPLSFDSQGYGEFDFKSVNSRSKYKAITPTEFSVEAHEARVLESVDSYKKLTKLSPATINANRDRLTSQIKEGYGYGDYVPYLDGESKVQVSFRPSDIPTDGQLLFPHDGEGLEHLLKEMGNPDSHLEPWRKRVAIESLTGRSWHGVGGLRDEMQPRIDQYQKQFEAAKEQGPTPGDTRINDAGHEEVFRDGRWRLAADKPADNKPAATPKPAEQQSTEIQGMSYEDAFDKVYAVFDPMKLGPRTVSAGESNLDAQAKPDGTELHPDPIGSIHDALKRIEKADRDRGALRNDIGWSEFTREFGTELAQQLMSGSDLSGNQLESALNMLSSKHRRQSGNLPTMEQLRDAISQRGDETEAKPKGNVQAEVKQTIHAKYGHELFVVAFERVPSHVYQVMKDKATDLGGYYSRYNKRGAIPGFQFKSPELAAEMMDFVGTLEKSATRFRIGDEMYVLDPTDLKLWRDRPWQITLREAALCTTVQS